MAPKSKAKAKAKPEPKASAKAKAKTKAAAKTNVAAKAAAGVAPKRSASSDAIADTAAPPLKRQKSSKVIETTVVKGRAAVDKEYPNHASCHVFEDPECVWDCMLNQSDVKSNNNKFYRIQLLQADTGGGFIVWNRWGRVGATGQTSTTQCSSLAQAKAQFQQKFSDKTKNAWANRASFVKHPGKYHLIEMDYEVESEAPAATGSKDRIAPPSKLPAEVQKLVKLICDVDMMKKQMVEVGYDAKKMPLGKISKGMIKEGYSTLKMLGEELDKARPSKDKLADLSSQFYTIIPHNFGFQRMSNFTISTPAKLKEKLLMIEALADIEVAHRLLERGGDEGNPVDKNFEKLKCDLKPMDSSSSTWKLLEEYVKNTHGETHSGYDLKVKQIFEVDREGEAERFKAFQKNPNRMLLWHGSRLTNWMGIISQGLRIAPPEAPVSGYMFGKGVYFADMVSKSANYCRTGRSDSRAVMLLAEVAVGKSNELLQSNYHADQLPKGCLSTLGLGRTAPNPEGTKTILDGVKVPMGKGAPSNVSNTSLQYNEFIVYDVAQIRMRYLFEMEFKFK